MDLQEDQEKDFSFIQNRVPSPLNNNFLLSAEQSKHFRQPSEGFSTSANNLMNQEEFKIGGLVLEQDQIDEEEDNIDEKSNDELETSKITLFTNENEEDQSNNQQDFIQDDNNTIPLNTESNYGSNNYFYSESAYPQSLGNIQQNTSGSFVETKQQTNFFIYNQTSSRGSNPLPTQGNGRESTSTPFYYDENSLMNLSNSPTSVMMMRSSNMTRGGGQQQQQDRIISSTKLNHKQNSLMVQILEDKKEEEEQDESMLLLPNTTNSNQQKYKQEQDEWVFTKKYNPLELPLQRNVSNESYQPFSPLDIQQLAINQKDSKQKEQNSSQNIELFSRGNPHIQLEDLQNFYQQNIQAINEEVLCNEDEILEIKKRLDFSRLSSLQNLSNATSQQQIFLTQQHPQSFMLQTQQSLFQTNNSFGNDTCHYSTFQGNEQERVTVPFDEVLKEHIKSISRNTMIDDFKSYRSQRSQTRDAEIQVNTSQNETPKNDQSLDNIHTERGISPQSKHTKGNNTTRPPLLKNNSQQQQIQTQKVVMNKGQPIQQVEIVQSNCINIFQGPCSSIANQQFPQSLIQSLQVPPQSRTNSTNSYSASVIDNLQQHQGIHQKHNVQQSYNKQNQSKKMNLNPCSDTPKEPSSLMVDLDFASQISQRQMMPKMGQMNKQQTFTNQYYVTLGDTSDDNVDDVEEQDPIMSNRPKKLKLKKKSKDNTSKTRVGSSKQRITNDKVQISRQQNQTLMSRTMIIQKDKIQNANSQTRQQVSQNNQILSQQISNITLKQNTIQIAKKIIKKQPQVQKSTQQFQINQLSFLNQQTSSPILLNGKSLPNSNLSSAQTSFLTQNNAKRPAKKTVTTNKKNTIPNKEVNQFDEKPQMKKLKKKNASITRNQLLGTMQIKPQLEFQEKNNNQQTKCNTHRSISRAKRATSQYEPEQRPFQIMGHKKNSQHILLDNKENIKPQIKQLPTKGSNLMSTGQFTRPEDLIQTYENLKLLNPQELLKEINSQQQRLSMKNFTQNLFTTMDSVDICKRTKTEQNPHHIKSMQTFDTVQDLDPYNMLTNMDSYRQVDKRTKASMISESSSDYNKKGSVNKSQVGGTSGIMQKMQSPYNSKTMKNKFNNNKKKPLECVSNNTSQIEQLSSAGGEDNCKRCSELIHLLKNNTRFVAR